MSDLNAKLKCTTYNPVFIVFTNHLVVYKHVKPLNKTMKLAYNTLSPVARTFHFALTLVLINTNKTKIANT